MTGDPVSPKTTKLVHRDPETGKFVASNDDFNDFEVVTGGVGVGVPAADLAGGTTFLGTGDEFEGVELIDYDEVVDRNEVAVLLSASHRLVAYPNSTETADGTVRAAVEISSSPALQAAEDLLGQTDVDDSADVDRTNITFVDSIDLVGRPLLAVGMAPFSDGATGVGGGGSAGEDTVELAGLPRLLAEFHPRDELFLNGAFDTWNIDDAGVHADVQYQHIYGVISQ